MHLVCAGSVSCFEKVARLFQTRDQQAQPRNYESKQNFVGSPQLNN